MKSNKLLKLLNHVYDYKNSPPSSMKNLFDKLNIRFEYLTVQYCTNCLSELHESSCSCNINNKQLPSELIIFPIEKEIVLANVVEIPKPFRDNEKNCIMLCLWHSPRGPTADLLLSRIVQDLSRLMKNGIYINVNNVGYVHFDLYIQAVIADGPGQSKITQMVSHNGYFACRVCELEGTYNSLDRTCTYTWSSFIDTSPSFRTKDRFQSCLEEVEHLQKMNNKNINVCAHGTQYLARQIAYWYTIDRSIRSMSVQNQPTINQHEHLIDGYMDENVILKDEDLPLWSEHVDNHYYLVNSNIVNFFIFPCTALLSKCLCFPFHDSRFTVCTPIDYELEHD
ncbi:unnamed protein product [Rotaria sp. Silwood2]|nr:unnamed protein product [Rotaria sp. Silwood2]